VVHTSDSAVIRAPRSEVFNLYVDFSNWHRLFPKTIKGVRFLRKEGVTQVLEVDHVDGLFINRLTVISPQEIELVEFKKRYRGTFRNFFESIPEGTLFTVRADIHLNGLFILATPFVKGIIRKQITEFVIGPIRKAAEEGFESQ
jgi:Polyketide cyclase / dehydrase and lipid transport.